MIVRVAARDVRSTVGKNLALLSEESGLDPWIATKGAMRKALWYK